ncbi:MAG: DUF3750 domain-containing protein [Roseitalea sp.]|nr:DUF3750 domain-containing protein [Roseitalea sp.]MBO6720486.1 DUF3750 domain-containing protein [Roseitalea sp.]MBO6743633.1 DUF3750 domain-containing protein [Roseitalea sp.]
MRIFLASLTLLFFLPIGTATAWWLTVDRPQSWREADWSGTGTLPDPAHNAEASIYVMAARTGGLKGALSVHSWLVYKRASDTSYTRYDKVGWGMPVRRNAYAADARWYSNRPFVIRAMRGDAAARLIPAIEAAIARYPHAGRDDYRMWPGPNSNTFVAHVLRAVPEIGAVLPPHAVGRDYLGSGPRAAVDRDALDVQMSLHGLAGLSAGLRSGFEVHLLGQAIGIDVMRPALKLPGIGRIGLPR